MRGPRWALALRAEFVPPAIVLGSFGDFPRPWALLRALFAELAARHDSAAVERAIAPHRGPLSLVFGGLEPLLDPDERIARKNAAAVSLGFLSHNFAIFADVFGAFQGALSALIDAETPTMSILDALDADAPSLTLLRGLVRDLGDRAPRVVFGEVTDLPPLAHLWERSRVRAAIHLTQLAMLPDTNVVEVSIPDKLPPAVEHSKPAAQVPWDDEKDLRAYALLRAGNIDRAGSVQVLDAMRSSFEAFGFDTTLRLGLDLIDASPELENDELAELHTLVGLSAYNRQVRGEGDLVLADLLGRHFAAALSYETDVIKRSHLLYRLAINEGRRKGQLEESLAIANDSVAVLSDAPAGARELSAYVEAWARNGRAYVLARLGRMSEAIADCERAFELAKAAMGGPLVPQREAMVTPIVLADNMAELWMRAGNLEEARHWQAKFAELEQAVFGQVGLSFRRLMDIERKAGRLAKAQEAAEGLVTFSRLEASVADEDLYLSELGELRYRRGDASGAMQCFRDALAYRRRIAPPEDIRATLMALGLACLRAERVGEADASFAEAATMTAEDEGALRAQIDAYRAFCAALVKDEGLADERVNAAVDLAVSSGERDTLLRVARLAGEVCLVLGRHEAAMQAFSQALEIASGDDDGPPSPAEDLVVVHMALARLTRDMNHVDMALSELPRALEDAEAWWILPELIAMATHSGAEWSASAQKGLDMGRRAMMERVERPRTRTYDRDG